MSRPPLPLIPISRAASLFPRLAAAEDVDLDDLDVCSELEDHGRTGSQFGEKRAF
jgi:hypothetical protein